MSLSEEELMELEEQELEEAWRTENETWDDTEPWMGKCQFCSTRVYRLTGAPVLLCDDCVDILDEEDCCASVVSWYLWYWRGSRGDAPRVYGFDLAFFDTVEETPPESAAPARPAKEILTEAMKGIVFGGERGLWYCDIDGRQSTSTTNLTSCFNHHSQRVTFVRPGVTYRPEEK